jgi:hypothetical protein
MNMVRAGFLITALVATSPGAVAQVISYNATSFPEEMGWLRRSVTFQSDRWLENGWFVQFTEMIQAQPGGPLYEKEDWYEHSLASFSGTTAWYCQWRMVTDGPSEAIPAIAPAAFVASGFSGILYHFTIAEDRVRLIRDAALPLVWADITPGPHTYLLELRGTESYTFYIDGQLIDSGVPEGAYPTSDSRLVFGARAPGETATTRWDYIRFGVIPQPGGGDYDSNGVIDATDVYFFLDCLLGPDADGPGCRWADLNGDGKVNGADIQPFSAALAE